MPGGGSQPLIQVSLCDLVCLICCQLGKKLSTKCLFFFEVGVSAGSLECAPCSGFECWGRGNWKCLSSAVGPRLTLHCPRGRDSRWCLLAGRRVFEHFFP